MIHLPLTTNVNIFEVTLPKCFYGFRAIAMFGQIVIKLHYRLVVGNSTGLFRNGAKMPTVNTNCADDKFPRAENSKWAMTFDVVLGSFQSNTVGGCPELKGGVTHLAQSMLKTKKNKHCTELANKESIDCNELNCETDNIVTTMATRAHDDPAYCAWSAFIHLGLWRKLKVRLFIASLHSQSMCSQICISGIFVDLQPFDCNLEGGNVRPR